MVESSFRTKSGMFLNTIMLGNTVYVMQYVRNTNKQDLHVSLRMPRVDWKSSKMLLAVHACFTRRLLLSLTWDPCVFPGTS